MRPLHVLFAALTAGAVSAAAFAADPASTPSDPPATPVGAVTPAAPETPAAAVDAAPAPVDHAAHAAAPAESPAPAPPAGDVKEVYAETPDDIAPYAKSGSYYHRYFIKPLPYRGAGRDKPEPTDLKSVHIGLIAPVDSPYDQAIGTAMVEGTILAIEQANQRGGYKGRLPYELILRNDNGLWGSSSNTFVELAYDQQCLAVLGSVDGSNTHIALRVALKAETPIIVTASSDPTMNETNIPWILRTSPDDRQLGYKLADLVIRQNKHERVAVIRVNDTYGRKGATEFKDACRRMGKPIVIEPRYALQDTDFSDQVRKVKDLQADAIVLWSNPEPSAVILRQLREAGVNVPVYGTERLAIGEFLEAAGELAEGMTLISTYDPTSTDAAWTTFADAYRKRFDREPDAAAAYTYDGTKIVLESLEHSGLNKARLRDVIYDMKTYDGVAGPMRFDATMANLGTIHVLKVHDGKFVSVR